MRIKRQCFSAVCKDAADAEAKSAFLMQQQLVGAQREGKGEIAIPKIKQMTQREAEEELPSTMTDEIIISISTRALMQKVWNARPFCSFFSLKSLETIFLK